jgi:hypothetical protein
MEWVIGANLDDIFLKREQRSKEVVTVSVSTDDEAESDTVSITYPRTSRAAAKQTKQTMSTSHTVKRVQFQKSPLPLKSAMKKNAGAIADASENTSESVVDSSVDSSAATSSEW